MHRPSLLPVCRHILSLGLALCCTSLIAEPVKSKRDNSPGKNKGDGALLIQQREDATILKWLHHGVESYFALDPDLSLDPALRTAANALRKAHLTRIAPLLAQWIAEERAQQRAAGGSGASEELYFPLRSRLFNEMALWQLDTGDAAYEEATLSLLNTEPKVCLMQSDGHFGDFSQRMTRIQTMPAVRRDAVLASEGQMLARWGQSRPAVQPMPVPLPQEQFAALVKRWQVGGARPALAFPPLLTYRVLAQREAYDAMDKDEQCALQQWWLQLSLLQGATPAQALTAFRYGTLSSASDRYIEAAEKPGESSLSGKHYPALARRFAVTGATTVRVRLDSAGRPQEASIVERKIDVPGIRHAPPVAFEQIFDAATLAYAMTGQSYTQTGDGYTSFQMRWSLDEAEKTLNGEGVKP